MIRLRPQIRHAAAEGSTCRYRKRCGAGSGIHRSQFDHASHRGHLCADLVAGGDFRGEGFAGLNGSLRSLFCGEPGIALLAEDGDGFLDGVRALRNVEVLRAGELTALT